MRHVGRIAEWNDEKGYGFIMPNGGGARSFVHVSSFEKRERRPQLGDLVSYEPRLDDRHRRNAMGVRLVILNAGDGPPGGLRFPRRTTGVLVLLALAVAGYLGKLPMLVPLVYGGMSAITFFAYGLDKSAARTRRWRTQESTLHLLELLAGWPGALIAQGSFRHKTRKTSFQFVFCCAVAINLGALAWLSQNERIATLDQLIERSWFQ